MSVICQLPSLSTDTAINTAYLIAAQSIMCTSVISEKRKFGNKIFTEGRERIHEWWNLESDRLARPSPHRLQYLQFKDNIDPKTFTIELSGVKLYYDIMFTDYDVTFPVLEHDDVESVLIDLYASALYSLTVLDDLALYTMYLSSFYSLYKLKEIEIIKPNFKPVRGKMIAPSITF